MAGIDKTYTDSYKDYNEFKEWADKQVIGFLHYGHVERVGYWVWELTEEDFSNGEIPIMNTPTWLDIYLIQNCPVEFVKNRMKSVYGKYYDELLTLKDPYGLNPDYKQNRKIVIRRIDRSKFPIHNKALGKKVNWWLQCRSFWFSYNSECNIWADRSAFPTNTNTMHAHTLKSIVRKLREQYLPSGLIFTISGICMGEEYELITK